MRRVWILRNLLANDEFFFGKSVLLVCMGMVVHACKMKIMEQKFFHNSSTKFVDVTDKGDNLPRE